MFELEDDDLERVSGGVAAESRTATYGDMCQNGVEDGLVDAVQQAPMNIGMSLVMAGSSLIPGVPGKVAKAMLIGSGVMAAGPVASYPAAGCIKGMIQLRRSRKPLVP